MVNIFYNALVANIEILNAIQSPVSQKNEFLHWVFNSLKNSTIAEIEVIFCFLENHNLLIFQNSDISEVSKKIIQRGIRISHSYFAFYDYNNVSIVEEVKLAYETEYYRLKSQLVREWVWNPLKNTIDSIQRFIETNIRKNPPPWCNRSCHEKASGAHQPVRHPVHVPGNCC